MQHLKTKSKTDLDFFYEELNYNKSKSSEIIKMKIEIENLKNIIFEYCNLKIYSNYLKFSNVKYRSFQIVSPNLLLFLYKHFDNPNGTQRKDYS